MKRGRSSCGERGFALLLTLMLLALLVLVVLTLATLLKVDTRLAVTATYQTQARQNALLGLGVALGELQRHAGPDDRVTAMAGVTGIAPQNRHRQWCGIWPANGTGAPRWMVSGAAGSGIPALSAGLSPLLLVAAGSVGTEGVDKEYVEVGKEVIVAPSGMSGPAAGAGSYAYWVGDEGVKVSAVFRHGEMQTPASSPGLRPDRRRMLGNYAHDVADNGRIILYEQLRLAAPGSDLKSAFHQLTVTHLTLAATAPAGVPRSGPYIAGAININTTSESAWRALLEFPDNRDAYWGLGAARTLSAARGIRDGIAGHGGPFASVAALADSGIVERALDRASPKITTVTPELFFETLGPIFTVRSDTFRIRAYGETWNPLVDPGQPDGQVEARAWCEAIVQRTPEALPGFGRRFVITCFRWLGPDDI